MVDLIPDRNEDWSNLSLSLLRFSIWRTVLLSSRVHVGGSLGDL